MAMGLFWHFGGDAVDRTGDDSFFPQKEMDLTACQNGCIQFENMLNSNKEI